MKLAHRFLVFLLLAVLPTTLLSQGQTVRAAYLKVTQLRYADYPELEKEWSRYHQRAIESGVHNGWQLWRNMHAGIDDPYQFITLEWFDSYTHTFGEDAPENWLEGAYTPEEWEKLRSKTLDARRYAFEEVANLLGQAENAKQSKYLVVGRMQVKPGMEAEYEKMELEIFKPYHEELIRREFLTHWGIWKTFPYKQGQPTYTVVNGYGSAKNLGSDKPVIDPSELGILYSMEEIARMVDRTRTMVSTEVWELVDYIFPDP